MPCFYCLCQESAIAVLTPRRMSRTTTQAIYVPADDLTDPAPATTFAHLDATTVLSRSIAELGIYPAVDPLDSTSRMLNARILGQEHYDTARAVQRVLQVSTYWIRCFCTAVVQLSHFCCSNAPLLRSQLPPVAAKLVACDATIRGRCDCCSFL